MCVFESGCGCGVSFMRAGFGLLVLIRANEILFCVVVCVGVGGWIATERGMGD